MVKEELIKDVYNFCKANYNQENVIKYSNYFKGDYDAWGLTTPMVRARVKELYARKDIDLNVVLDAAPSVIKQGKYEEISIILLLIDSFYKQFNITAYHEIEKLYLIGIDNWAHADTLAMFILPKFVNQNIITPTDLKKWLKAENKFQRRSVPVTLIKSLKTCNDFNDYFKIIESLMVDKDREVHQGVGWFLREAWKKNHEVTESFLLIWKDRAPRLIIQYATEKMTKEEKLRFRKEK